MDNRHDPIRRNAKGALRHLTFASALLLGAMAAHCGSDAGSGSSGATGGGGASVHDAAGGAGGVTDDAGSDAAITTSRDGSAGSGGGNDASGTGGTGGASDGSAGVDTRDATLRDAATADSKDASADGFGGSPEAGGMGDAGDGGIVPPTGYKLVWHDEFDIDGRPNAANWKYENGFVRNEELQWYQSDNARVESGLLIIEGRRERVANPNYQAGSSDWKTNRQYAEYTSASLLTSGLHSWQFGRLEMLGRIVAKAGLWPAWWTLGTSGEWPSNGEVDIMEYYKSNVLANVACGTTTRWVAKWDSVSKAVSSFGDPAWDTKFHLWRMDWDDQKIDLYLDGVLMNTSDLQSMLNPDGMSPFRQPHYMMLNLAIGGANGGDPSATTFPTHYEVDYVRVFQKL